MERLKKVSLWLAGTLLCVWLFGAIWFDGPLSLGLGKGNAWLAILWAALLLAAGFTPKPRLVRALLILVVLVPWLTIRPSNERDWKPEFARTGWSEINGDQVTLHEVRNFDYTPEGQVTERWESRTVHLSNLRGIDFFLDAFMGDWVAHPIMSFDFGPDGRVCLSIETRREKTESFSMLGGLYKMFELQYLFGDEKDFIRVRTNIRKEPLYLFPLSGTQEMWLEFFMDSVKAQNALRERPQFYNVISANCTTSLRAHRQAEQKQRFDIRLLLNGKMDEMLFHRGALKNTELPFPELRRRSFITPAAQAAHSDPAFSDLIRVGLPGTVPDHKGYSKR
jgi:hypothetical protein